MATTVWNPEQTGPMVLPHPSGPQAVSPQAALPNAAAQQAARPGSFSPSLRNAPADEQGDPKTAPAPAGETLPRDPALRALYARAALAQIPRLLTSLDRHPLRPTYGCFDRQYWHYRTAAFPSGMYQEAALPLALVYRHWLPGNPWYRQEAVRLWAVAAIHYAARSSHRDGSCDDYYPAERALGAAVFSLAALARTCQVLELREPSLIDFLERRAGWVAGHGETGRLANHQALAALALWHVFELTGKAHWLRAARQRLDGLLDWQDTEGWFDEYGGADPGYQSLTIECLARLARAGAHPGLAGPLVRAVEFARAFLHPDGSFGGPYGSRGTYHFFPHGFELLAENNAAAAQLADGFLACLATQRTASFDDDRLVAHRLGSLIESYLTWSPRQPRRAGGLAAQRFFSSAGLHVIAGRDYQTIVSSARGGALRHQQAGTPARVELGLVLELADGRLATSEFHDRGPGAATAADTATPSESAPTAELQLRVQRPFCRARAETVSPWKQALLHLGMSAAGRWLRTLARWLLQRRLITGRRPLPIDWQRTLTWQATADGGLRSLRVTDRITLRSPRLQVRRMAYVADQQLSYVAAANVFQEAALTLTDDLSAWVEPLNRERQVEIVRELNGPWSPRSGDGPLEPRPTDPANASVNAACGNNC